MVVDLLYRLCLGIHIDCIITPLLFSCYHRGIYVLNTLPQFVVARQFLLFQLSGSPTSTQRTEYPQTAKMLRSVLWLILATAVSSTPLSQRGAVISSHPPTATLSPSNGNPKAVFVGRTLPGFNQDLFLGIKYADKPARFTAAELKSHYASNDSNSVVYDLSAAVSSHGNTVYYNATQYGYDCPGYGSDTTELVNMGLIRLNEDCLNLNVIRPRNVGEKELPVMLWIFGGGWSQGATADPRLVDS